MKYIVYINNEKVSQKNIDDWETKRLNIVAEKLNSNSKTVAELSEFKQKLGHKEIRNKLKFKLKLAFITSKLMSLLSSGKRKIALTEMIIEEGITAEEISKEIDKLMMEQNKENEFVNLSANPDHYLLHTQNNTLEVIETTGGSPFPIQMFITFGEEKGLTIPRDNSYPFQSVGIAKLADHTIIGGVRHQFKDEAKGFSAKLAVEFPVLTPNYFIKQHQIHLACEWKNWFQWVVLQKSKKQ